MLNAPLDTLYLPDSDIIFNAKLYDDSFCNITIKHDSIQVFNKFYEVNNDEKIINDQFHIPGYDVGSNHSISIYAIDEFELISEIYNYSYTVGDGSPMIKFSDVMHPISVETRNMKISAYYYIWPGSSKATFVSTINEFTNISLQQFEDFIFDQWNPIILSVSFKYLYRNTMNNISISVINSLLNVSNTLNSSIFLEDFKYDYTVVSRVISFSSVAMLYSGRN